MRPARFASAMVRRRSAAPMRPATVTDREGFRRIGDSRQPAHLLPSEAKRAGHIDGALLLEAIRLTATALREESEGRAG